MSRILIVEDHAALRAGYCTILAGQGHEVYEAADGAVALAQAEKVHPDLILLDLVMPRMDGLAFLRAYDVKVAHPNVAVVIFSNSSAPDKVQEAMELGARRYLIKAVISPRAIAKVVQEELGAPSK
jgi:CheY-like chemotaxis protein